MEPVLQFYIVRLCLNLEPVLPWEIYIDPALAITYRRRCQEFGLQQSTKIVCRQRGMQLVLPYNKPDYLTCNPTSRHGTGYTFTWRRPTVEPVWVYWFHFVRPWTELCPLCIFYNTDRIHYTCTHLINQLQKVCRVLSFMKIPKFDFLTISLNV